MSEMQSTVLYVEFAAQRGGWAMCYRPAIRAGALDVRKAFNDTPLSWQGTGKGLFKNDGQVDETCCRRMQRVVAPIEVRDGLKYGARGLRIQPVAGLDKPQVPGRTMSAVTAT